MGKGQKMKAILFTALALAIGIATSRANELVASPRSQSARFAAMSLTTDQGVRAIISNVLAPEEIGRAHV